MIAPTFEPESTPGASVAAYSRGVDQGQTWMERSNQMGLQQQQEKLNQQQIVQHEILRPVVEAKAKADLATAANTLTSAKTLQDLRTKAAMLGPQAEQELITASQIPDFATQEAKLGELQAKYSWMENVPEMKPLVTTIDNARAKATTMVLANKHIESAQAIADTRASGALDVATERTKSASAIADLKTKTDLEKQQRELEHKREVDDLQRELAQLKSTTATTVGAGHDTARTTSAETTGAARVQSSAGRVYAEEADTLEKAAQNETDAEAKTLLQKKAQAYRAKSEQALKPSSPAAAAPGGAPAVTAPTVVDKNAATVSIGGKTYPVFKDAKGNRAYQVDGHFVPLTSE